MYKTMNKLQKHIEILCATAGIHSVKDTLLETVQISLHIAQLQISIHFVDILKHLHFWSKKCNSLS